LTIRDTINSSWFGDLIEVEWLDASESTGRLERAHAKFDTPVRSVGYFLGIKGKRTKHVVIAKEIIDNAKAFHYNVLPIGMIETVTMALMATTLAVLLAVPISFPAARNLMGGNPVTFGVYVIVRTILNIVRSIESLIIAIVFVIIVGLGPFAGMLAIAVHSVAALAKLYSEVIEGIDPGPIEAIRATGAHWVQVVRYGVVPQIVPPFPAFTIYRWDINLRSSTIVGFVGGGGIGWYLVQWIQINEMREVSAAFIAIAIVVVTLDYISARIRERLV